MCVWATCEDTYIVCVCVSVYIHVCLEKGVFNDRYMEVLGGGRETMYLCVWRQRRICVYIHTGLMYDIWSSIIHTYISPYLYGYIQRLCVYKNVTVCVYTYNMYLCKHLNSIRYVYVNSPLLHSDCTWI